MFIMIMFVFPFEARNKIPLHNLLKNKNKKLLKSLKRNGVANYATKKIRFNFLEDWTEN